MMVRRIGYAIGALMGAGLLFAVIAALLIAVAAGIHYMIQSWF